MEQTLIVTLQGRVHRDDHRVRLNCENMTILELPEGLAGQEFKGQFIWNLLFYLLQDHRELELYLDHTESDYEAFLNRLEPIVKEAVQKDLISLGRGAEILGLGLQEMRKKAQKWECR